MVNSKLKIKCHQTIINSLLMRIESLEKSISDLEEARDGETKSSMGDKYETGRSIIQFEKEKQNAQLIRFKQFVNQVNYINPEKQCKEIEAGCLVKTNEAYYFFSVAFGKTKVDGDFINCININSPFGKVLRGKVKGDNINFRGRVIELLSIA